MYEKWHQNYYEMRPYALSTLSYPVQLVVGLLTHRKVMRTLHGQGTGRFSAEEISLFRRQIFESIDALLVVSKTRQKEAGGAGDAVFWTLGGDGPSEADAVLYGFVVGVLICSAYVYSWVWWLVDVLTVLHRCPESQKVVRSLPTIVEYARRIHDRYFPDYTCWE